MIVGSIWDQGCLSGCLAGVWPPGTGRCEACRAVAGCVPCPFGVTRRAGVSSRFGA
jgi:hypothetical protein